MMGNLAKCSHGSVCPDMPLPLPSSRSSRASFLSCKNFDDFCMRGCSAVSRARFQCHGNSESLIKYVCVCVCVVLEQVLPPSHTRLKICSKSSSHERISFLERGPFHLWCFCRRRPKEVLKCFKDITKIKKRKPQSIHATLWPRYLTQMM